MSRKENQGSGLEKEKRNVHENRGEPGLGVGEREEKCSREQRRTMV